MGLRIGFAGFGFITVDLVAGGSSLPAGATAHLDFISGFYYAGGQERAIGDVLTGTPNVGAEGAVIDGQGTPWWPTAQGALLTDIDGLVEGAGITIVARTKSSSFADYPVVCNIPNAAEENLTLYFNTDSANKLTVSTNEGETESGNTPEVDEITGSAMTYIGSTRRSVSLNGGSVVSAALVGGFASVSSVQIGHSGSAIPIGYLRSITFYPAVADAALPALSAL